MKVSKIIKRGNCLLIYKRIGLFKSYLDENKEFEQFEDNKWSFLGTGIDKSRKYIIGTFVLRNKKDIEPYISKRKGELNDNR